MTGLEVLDDAVKIGLGGFIGWLLARGARSHEFEKERRRRKQDCLEQVIENLGEQESAFDALCVASLAYGMAAKQGKNELEKIFLTNVNQNSEQSDLALSKLDRSRGKLIVFGFDECATELRNYHRALVDFRVVLSDVRNGKKDQQVYTSERAQLRKSAESLRQAVTKVFATL